ncbi:MAG: hypothetical protein ACE5IR_07535 [bacterium]
MKKHFKEIEDILRNGKLPDADSSELRHQVWQRVLQNQRQHRTSKLLLRLPPWIWVMASIILILLCILLMLLID